MTQPKFCLLILKYNLSWGIPPHVTIWTQPTSTSSRRQHAQLGCEQQRCRSSSLLYCVKSSSVEPRRNPGFKPQTKVLCYAASRSSVSTWPQLAEGGQMSHRYKLTLTPSETVLALVLIPCGHPYPRPVRVQILNKRQLWASHTLEGFFQTYNRQLSQTVCNFQPFFYCHINLLSPLANRQINSIPKDVLAPYFITAVNVVYAHGKVFFNFFTNT